MTPDAPCGVCDGNGKVLTCDACHGTGRVPAAQDGPAEGRLMSEAEASVRLDGGTRRACDNAACEQDYGHAGACESAPQAPAGRPRRMSGYHGEPCQKCGQYTVLLRCLSCGWGAQWEDRRATCIGSYEGLPREIPACGACCAHGQGACRPIGEWVPLGLAEEAADRLQQDAAICECPDGRCSACAERRVLAAGLRRRGR